MMTDHLKIRHALREKSAVSIRQKRKRDALQKNRAYHLDIQAYESHSLPTQPLDTEEYQSLVSWLNTHLAQDLFTIDVDAAYNALRKLKEHSLLLGSADERMIQLVADLVKEDLGLYRRIARLLYRRDQRNVLVLYFLVLYHQRDKESRSSLLSAEDMNDLVINIVQIYNTSTNSSHTMFYATMLL